MINFRYMFFSVLMAWGAFSIFDDSNKVEKLKEAELKTDSLKREGKGMKIYSLKNISSVKGA